MYIVHTPCTMTDMSNTYTNIDINEANAVDYTVPAAFLKELRQAARWQDPALRSAAISVDLRRDGEFSSSTLTLHTEVRDPAAEGGSVRRRFEQPLFGSSAENYIAQHAPDRANPKGTYRYVAMSTHYVTDPMSVLRTLANMLRTGDVMRAIFRLANDTNTMAGKGITRDECYLCVFRSGRSVGAVCVDTLIGNGAWSMVDTSYRGEAN